MNLPWKRRGEEYLFVKFTNFLDSHKQILVAVSRNIHRVKHSILFVCYLSITLDYLSGRTGGGGVGPLSSFETAQAARLRLS